MRLSKGQRKVAQFILEQPQTIVTSVASEVGRLAGVSESTVIRFCYSIDLSGYNELQEKLQEYFTVQNLTTGPKLEKASAKNIVKSEMLNQIKCVSKTIEKLDSKQVANMLNLVQEAKKTYLVGYRENEKYVKFLQHHLETQKFNIEAIDQTKDKIALALKSFEQSDMLILFAENQIYEDTDYILKVATAKKVKIALICFDSNHEYIKRSDAYIYIHNVDENIASVYSFLLSFVGIINHKNAENSLSFI